VRRLLPLLRCVLKVRLSDEFARQLPQLSIELECKGKKVHPRFKWKRLPKLSQKQRRISSPSKTQRTQVTIHCPSGEAEINESMVSEDTRRRSLPSSS
jgi:hypothetical protein